MPQLQVVDFGQNAGSDALTNLARGLSSGYFQAQEQKSNEDIFDRIKENYSGEDPMMFMEDVLNAKGLGQEYKKNKLDEIKTLVDLKNKKVSSDYAALQKTISLGNLNVRRTSEENKEKRLEQEAKKAKQELPIKVSTYINNQLKEEDEKIDAEDKSMLNSRMINLMDEGFSIPEAFNQAYEFISEKNRLIDTETLTLRPIKYPVTQINQHKQKVEEARKKVTHELSQLYEAGVTAKKDLRKILERASWEKEEIKEILDEVVNKKLKKKETQEEKKPIDNILFG
jgi:hypothetical protein